MLLLSVLFWRILGEEDKADLRFADDIDGVAGEEEELANLVERLYKVSTAFGMEISAEKSKLMTNNTSGINTEIKVNGQKFETVTSSKYLGSVIIDEGSKYGILSSPLDWFVISLDFSALISML